MCRWGRREPTQYNMINIVVLARAIPMKEGEERDDIVKCEKMRQLTRMPTSSGSIAEQE